MTQCLITLQTILVTNTYIYYICLFILSLLLLIVLSFIYFLVSCCFHWLTLSLDVTSVLWALWFLEVSSPCLIIFLFTFYQCIIYISYCKWQIKFYFTILIRHRRIWSTCMLAVLSLFLWCCWIVFFPAWTYHMYHAPQYWPLHYLCLFWAHLTRQIMLPLVHHE
jgi:hypothetical protein